MRSKRVLARCVAIVAVVVTAGCVVSAWVPNGPPAPLVEARAVAPGPAFVWIGGWWEWHSRWVWHNGYWGRPPHPHAMWMPGHWDRRPRGWRWTPGHWRR
jgi:hypothetical protein